MLTQPKFLRILAGVLLLSGVFLWLLGGARAGFYRTYYEVVRVDEVTGLEFPERVERLLPGIEPLAGGLLLFVLLVVASGVIEARSRRLSKD